MSDQDAQLVRILRRRRGNNNVGDRLLRISIRLDYAQRLDIKQFKYSANEDQSMAWAELRAWREIVIRRINQSSRPPG